MPASSDQGSLGQGGLDRAPTAGLVVIGNEILSGKIEDANSPFLCRELRFLGVVLGQIVTIPDAFDLIGETVRDYAGRFTWVFTSGGVGPTHDDITIDAIAAGFGVKAVVDPRLERALRERYGERMTEAHLQMAKVPEGAELVEVPGMSYPQVLFRNVFILPGVPELFRYKFNAIKHRFASRPIALRELFLRADEGTIAAALRETASAYPDVLIGSYPNFRRGDYSVKVTLEAHAPESVAAALADVQARLGPLAIEVVRVN